MCINCMLIYSLYMWPMFVYKMYGSLWYTCNWLCGRLAVITALVIIWFNDQLYSHHSLFRIYNFYSIISWQYLSNHVLPSLPCMHTYTCTIIHMWSLNRLNMMFMTPCLYFIVCIAREQSCIEPWISFSCLSCYMYTCVTMVKPQRANIFTVSYLHVY